MDPFEKCCAQTARLCQTLQPRSTPFNGSNMNNFLSLSLYVIIGVHRTKTDLEEEEEEEGCLIVEKETRLVALPRLLLLRSTQGVEEGRKIRKRGGEREGGLKLNEDALNRELFLGSSQQCQRGGLKTNSCPREEHPPEVCFEFERERERDARAKKTRCSGRQPFYKWIRVLFQQQDFHDPS